MSQPHHKARVQKTSHDLQASLVAFQRAQQVSAKRQREVVQGVKLAVDADDQRPRSVHLRLSGRYHFNVHIVIQASRPKVCRNNVRRNYCSHSCRRTSLRTRSLSFKNEKLKFVRLSQAFMNSQRFSMTWARWSTSRVA